MPYLSRTGDESDASEADAGRHRARRRCRRRHGRRSPGAARLADVLAEAGDGRPRPRWNSPNSCGWRGHMSARAPPRPQQVRPPRPGSLAQAPRRSGAGSGWQPRLGRGELPRQAPPPAVRTPPQPTSRLPEPPTAGSPCDCPARPHRNASRADSPAPTAPHLAPGPRTPDAPPPPELSAPSAPSSGASPAPFGQELDEAATATGSPGSEPPPSGGCRSCAPRRSAG